MRRNWPKDRTSTWIDLALLVGVALGVLACEPRDGTKQTDAGSWYEVRPPPDAPKGMKCWVWPTGMVDSRMGGPVCFEK